MLYAGGQGESKLQIGCKTCGIRDTSNLTDALMDEVRILKHQLAIANGKYLGAHKLIVIF